MAFNEMFSSLSGEGENSDRIMTKNGARVKWMTGKQPITFSILPAINPENPDRRVSYLPSILPGAEGQPDTLSEWGNYAWCARGIGHGDFKERASVVLLKQSRDDDTVCPLSLVYATIKRSPEWQYLTDAGKFGDPNRARATLPLPRLLMFANVYVKGEEEKGAQVGVFSKSLANKLMGPDGIVWARDPKATDEQIAQDYMSAYANGDITAPQNAPAFTVEKGHDKGEMSAYEIRYALDSARRIVHIPATQEVLATRYDITKLDDYLNILTPDQMVQLLIRELNGRSPAGYHEYALLKEALGGTWQIPEPPSAPGAIPTVQGADVPKAEVPAATPVPAASSASEPPVQVTPTDAPETAPAATVSAQVPVAPVPKGNEADSALKAAVSAGAAVPPATQPVPTAAPAAKPQVVGDAVPKFDKAAFLAKMAAKGAKA